MSASLTVAAVKHVSGVCATALQHVHFRRRVPHLFRQSSDLYQGICFQASRWGTYEAGKFTINLNVTSASLYAQWTGSALPANPATALWPIRTRLGSVCPEKKDMWWDVTSRTDVPAVAAEVASRLQEHGMPFFQRYSSSSVLLELLQGGVSLPGMTKPQMPLLRSMLLKEANQLEEAGACIREALRDNTSPGFRCTILGVAHRLNLPATYEDEQ